MCITGKFFATITKMESHVLFPYCLRSLILIVSSRNIKKAGDLQKRYDLSQTKTEIVFVERIGSADDGCLM